jgi:hypothetical protein
MQMDCSSMNEQTIKAANNQGSIIARLNFITFPAHPAIWEPMTTLHMTQKKTNWRKEKGQDFFL